MQHSILGYNYRLSELHAALGSAQMSRLAEILERRATVAEVYRRALNGNALLILPPDPPPHARMSWFVYVVQLRPEDGLRRDDVLAAMQDRGIQCGRYFAPVHLQPAYAGCGPQAALPHTEAISRRTIALPFFTTLSEAQVRFVAEKLLDICASGRG